MSNLNSILLIIVGAKDLLNYWKLENGCADEWNPNFNHSKWERASLQHPCRLHEDWFMFYYLDTTVFSRLDIRDVEELEKPP